MKKRTLLLAIALVASLALAVTGTLAYLTDTDSDVNVMILGNVDIEQLELQRADTFTGHTGTLKEGDLVPFEEGKPLYPAFPVNGLASDYTAEQTDLLAWGPYVTTGMTRAAGPANGLWNDEKLIGAVDKFVFVKNVGDAPAYYRTVFAFECPKGIEFSPSPDKQLMMNVNGNALFAWDEHGYVTISGQRYLLMSATYQSELAPGEISRPSLLQVVMTHNATNEDVKKLGPTYEILVVTQAVQTTNMPDANTALKAAFGELSEDSHPWMAEGEEGAQPPYESEPAIPVQVATAEELTAALAAGNSVLLTDDVALTEAVTVSSDLTINLGGNKLDIVGLEAAADVTIADGTINENDATYPQLTVKGGSLTLNSVDVINDNQPCFAFDNGKVKAVEAVALQVFDGNAVLNDTTITIEYAEQVDFSNIVGISVHKGSVTMNGGAVNVEAAGGTTYTSDAAFMVINPGEKVFNLNNVTLNTGDADYFYASESKNGNGTATVNTTDSEADWAGKVTVNSGVTVTINYDK